MAWTTATLLAQVRRVASLPSAVTALGYTDADLLAHADVALQGHILPLVANARDEHGVHFADVEVPAGQEYVRLPPRVVAGRLRDITRRSAAGNSWVSVPRLEPEDTARWATPAPIGIQSLSVVVEAGFLRLVPVPTQTQTLRISYVRTPSTLASVASCFQVSAITPGAFVSLTTLAATTGGALYDLVMVGNGDSLADRATNIGSGTSPAIALADMDRRYTNTSPETARYLAEGLFLCPAGTTCIVPLPDVASTLLSHATAIGFMASIGDSEGASRTQDALDAMTSQLVPLLSERIEGEPQTVRPRAMSRGRGIWRP